MLRSSCIKLQKKVLEYFYACFYFSEICIPSIKKVRWCYFSASVICSYDRYWLPLGLDRV